MRSNAKRSALNDILHHIALAQHFSHGQTFDSFRDDVMRLYAVTRCLEIISEASRRLSSGLNRSCPHPERGSQRRANAAGLISRGPRRSVQRAAGGAVGTLGKQTPFLRWPWY